MGDLWVRMQAIVARIERLWARIDQLEIKMTATAQDLRAQRSK